MVCLFMCHAVLCTMPTCICERKEVQSLAQLPVATTLILPTGELCFEPVVFNRRQHQLRILWVDCCLSVLFLLTAILTFLNAHCCHCTLTASSICCSHQGCCPDGSKDQCVANSIMTNKSLCRYGLLYSILYLCSNRISRCSV